MSFPDTRKRNTHYDDSRPAKPDNPSPSKPVQRRRHLHDDDEVTPMGQMKRHRAFLEQLKEDAGGLSDSEDEIDGPQAQPFAALSIPLDPDDILDESGNVYDNSSPTQEALDTVSDDLEADGGLMPDDDPTPPRTSRSRTLLPTQRSLTEYQHWKELLPKLLAPYLRYLATQEERESLGETDTPWPVAPPVCTKRGCAMAAQPVICMRYNGMFLLSFTLRALTSFEQLSSSSTSPSVAALRTSARHFSN